MLTQVNDSIKKAIKTGDKETVDVLRLVKAELLNNEKTATPRPELDVVKSYSKKLSKALDAFANRPEQLAKLQTEIEIVATLLPVAVSEQTIRDYTESIIQNIKSTTMTEELNKGRVIKAVKERLPDADGALIAKVVNECLK